MAAVSKLFPTATRLLYYDTMEDMRKAALSSCIVFISHQARSLLSWAPPFISATKPFLACASAGATLSNLPR